MDYIEYYKPLVYSIAKKYSKGNQALMEDLAQEGFLKIIKLFKKKPPEIDFTSKDWERMIQTCVTNRILDQLRIESNYKKLCQLEDVGSLKQEYDFAENQDSQVIGKSILTQLLDHFKNRKIFCDKAPIIFSELVEPSEEFCFYQRKRDFVYKAYNQYLLSKAKRALKKPDTTALMDYLELEPDQYNPILERIQKAVTRLIPR